MSQRFTKVCYGAALLLALSAWQCGRTQPPPPAPLADYGDAPDGQPAGYRTGPGTGREGKFPSLFNSANPEFAMSLRPLGVPPAGVTVSPIPATLAPEQLIMITMPAGAAVTLGLSATATPANNGVLDPTRPPKPPGADSRMGYVKFHPL